jgi:hypothetical protein
MREKTEFWCKENFLRWVITSLKYERKLGNQGWRVRIFLGEANASLTRENHAQMSTNMKICVIFRVEISLE